VAAEFGIEQDVFLFDLELDKLLSSAGSQRKMAEVIRYPAVEQDLALIVDEGTSAGALEAAIRSASLVQSAAVFDVYRGGQVPPGKKSIAFAVTYQAPDHTLTDEEVAKTQRKIVERLKREFSAEVRGA
jgi:phenylalanyl-tRNA synthetase beta chain